MKTCLTCKSELPISDFYETGGYVKAHCKPCVRTAGIPRRRRNKDNFLRRTFGISIETFEAMVWVQDDRCACCGNRETARHPQSGEPLSLAVDHCHETGKVRGLLCQQCNHGIGQLGDNLAGVMAAATYLQGAPVG